MPVSSSVWWRRYVLAVAAGLCGWFESGTAAAQVNTSGVRGVVVNEQGAPIANAEITLAHVPTGTSLTSRSNSAGAFVFTGQRVGGPYTVVVKAAGYETRTIERVQVGLGKLQQLTIALQARVEELVVVGAPTAAWASGKTSFDAKAIGEMPSIGRDPKDVVRLLPEAYIDGTDKQLSIGGAHNRFNSVTVDGIRQDDDFGLNLGGYPTQRSPISLSAIEELSIEMSPFDVRYSGFLGGNVNIVTKSGSNAWHGSAFFNFSNDDLTGNRSKDDTIALDFRELGWGATLSGPIVHDKLHFFVGVDALSARTPFSLGAAGSGAANEVADISQADLARVQEIARRVYDYDAGAPSQSLDEADLKLLAKLDWNIDLNHRLVATYQRTGGNRIQNQGYGDDYMPLTSNWYNKSDTLHAYSARLYSDWSASLNTEIQLSGKNVGTRQESLGKRGFMEAEIETSDGGEINLGPDRFRHANELDNSVYHAGVKADYLLSSHLITAGYETEYLQVYNLFVQDSDGVAHYDSIDAFESRTPSSITYANAVTNDVNDGAADWTYGVHALYLQDELEVTSQISAQAGLRFETYHALTAVTYNPRFEERYGFRNTATLSGRSVLLPRAGVSYRPLRGLNLRGGFGLYSGGTPNVWVSNNYTNDGVTIVNTTSTDPAVIDGFDGYNIPQAMLDALQPGDGDVNALDPDFKIPSSWKLGLGADYKFDAPYLGDDYEATLNFVYSKVYHGVRWVDLRRDLASIDDNQPVGVLPDGRTYYNTTDFPAGRGYDLLLTNTRKGYGYTASLGLKKRFDVGLTLYGAYARQRALDVNPATSSRAISNYGYVAVGEDPNRPELATSNYERAHRFIGVAQFERELLPGLATGLSLFWESRSGQPFSYTFGGSSTDLARLYGETSQASTRRRMLFYVPKGDGSDVILDGIDPAEMEAFLEETGLDAYRGEIAPRNAFRSPWLHRLDLRLTQQIPHPLPGHRARFVLDIENVGNLLNDGWGRYEQVPFGYMVTVVDVNVDPVTGRYRYSNLRNLKEQPAERVDVLLSVWRLQAGVAYEF